MEKRQMTDTQLAIAKMHFAEGRDLCDDAIVTGLLDRYPELDWLIHHAVDRDHDHASEVEKLEDDFRSVSDELERRESEIQEAVSTLKRCVELNEVDEETDLSVAEALGHIREALLYLS